MERREKRIVNLLGTVNSQPINAVSRDEIRDPSLEGAEYIRIFSSQIRERDGVISFPADFDASGIIVINKTKRVVIRFLAQISNVQ